MGPKMYQPNVVPPITAKYIILPVQVGDGTVDHSFAYCHELYEEEVPDEIENIKTSFILDGSALGYRHKY